MRDEQEMEPRPSLWDELLGNNHHRKPATPKGKIPPGFYDDFAYTEESEEGFGTEDFYQELRAIRRLKQIKLQQQENNNNE